MWVDGRKVRCRFTHKWIRRSSKRTTLTHQRPQNTQLVRRNLDSSLAFSLPNTKAIFQAASRAKSTELGLKEKTIIFFTGHDSRQIEFLPFISFVLSASACHPTGLPKQQINTALRRQLSTKCSHGWAVNSRSAKLFAC